MYPSKIFTISCYNRWCPVSMLRSYFLSVLLQEDTSQFQPLRPQKSLDDVTRQESRPKKQAASNNILRTCHRWLLSWLHNTLMWRIRGKSSACTWKRKLFWFLQMFFWIKHCQHGGFCREKTSRPPKSTMNRHVSCSTSKLTSLLSKV